MEKMSRITGAADAAVRVRSPGSRQGDGVSSAGPKQGHHGPGGAVPGDRSGEGRVPWEGPEGDSPEAGGEGEAGQETQRALRAGRPPARGTERCETAPRDPSHFPSPP